MIAAMSIPNERKSRSLLNSILNWFSPPWEEERCRILGKRYQELDKDVVLPAEFSLPKGRRLKISWPYRYPAGWFLEVRTPYGIREIRVTRIQYEKFQTGEMVDVQLRQPHNYRKTGWIDFRLSRKRK